MGVIRNEFVPFIAAIDLFEDGTAVPAGAGTGLQAQLAKEVSNVQVPFTADNEEEDVQVFINRN